MLQVLIGIDQLANTFFGGMADETISARAHRKAHSGWFWRGAERLINTIFFSRSHCKDAYIAEFEKRQLPSVYRGPSVK